LKGQSERENQRREVKGVMAALTMTADIRFEVTFDFLPTKRTCSCPPERLNCLTKSRGETNAIH